MLQENDSKIPTSWAGLSYVLDLPCSVSFTVRAFNFKHIKGVTTMLSVVREHFFSLLSKMWTTVFQFPKRSTKRARFSCKIKKTKVLLSYKIYNHYFRKSRFKNCISILLHYLDWYHKKIDQGNRKYSWKIWMMELDGIWVNSRFWPKESVDYIIHV